MISHDAYVKVVKYFNGDKFKACKWFDIPNSELGGKSPNYLIKKKQQKKVEEFINKNLNST